MSPEGQLYGVQRSVQNLQEELKKEYGKDAPDLKIDPDLAKAMLLAEDQKARDEAARELFRDIGRQMPSRFVDKWNALAVSGHAGKPQDTRKKYCRQRLLCSGGRSQGYDCNSH